MTQSGGCAFNTQPLEGDRLAHRASLEDHTEERPTDHPAVAMATIAHKSRLLRSSCGGDIRNSPYHSVDPAVQYRYRRLLGDPTCQGTPRWYISALLALRASSHAFGRHHIADRKTTN